MKQHHADGLMPDAGRARTFSVELQTATLRATYVDLELVRGGPSFERRPDYCLIGIERDQVIGPRPTKAFEGAKIVNRLEKVRLSGTIVAVDDVEMGSGLE
jgi:hypothetical protein